MIIRLITSFHLFATTSVPSKPSLCHGPGDMGNLVSFSTPKSDVKNFHELSALDIDKKNVDFSALDGKVLSWGLLGMPRSWMERTEQSCVCRLCCASMWLPTEA